MKITFEDKINGISTWEPACDDFEIHEVLQAVKGMLVSHGYHEIVVNDEFLSMAQDIKDEYREEDDSEVIDPVKPRTWDELYKDNPEKLTTMEKLIAQKNDNLLKWPSDFDGAHSSKGSDEE